MTQEDKQFLFYNSFSLLLDLLHSCLRTFEVLVICCLLCVRLYSSNFIREADPICRFIFTASPYLLIGVIKENSKMALRRSFAGAKLVLSGACGR